MAGDGVKAAWYLQNIFFFVYLKELQLRLPPIFKFLACKSDFYLLYLS